MINIKAAKSLVSYILESQFITHLPARITEKQKFKIILNYKQKIFIYLRQKQNHKIETKSK